MNESDACEAYCQRLIKFFINQKSAIDLRGIFKEMEYPNRRALIDDITSINKTMKNQGIRLIIYPSTCIASRYFLNKKAIS